MSSRDFFAKSKKLYMQFLPLSIGINITLGTANGFITHLETTDKKKYDFPSNIGYGIAGGIVGGGVGFLYPIIIPYFVYKYAKASYRLHYMNIVEK